MQARESQPYIGRFAPSPTGPLHFGSLVAATASYLQARARSGQWLVRVEDIDPPREDPGATELILEALDRYGFHWDGEVIFQSESSAAHLAALDDLMIRGIAYPCTCSRKDLRTLPSSPLGKIYPGYCRDRTEDKDAAIRVRTDNTPIRFDDALQGLVKTRLERESGDFVIRRRDGLIAYHLAVVVDDHLQGVTEVVRGIDLLDSTPRQIWLQQLLGYTTPNYMHIPVITHPNGDKLSKLTGSPGIPLDAVEATLVRALEVLQQHPPGFLHQTSIDEIWAWAKTNWAPENLSGITAITDSP